MVNRNLEPANMRVGLDEGKVCIRSSEKNKNTGKYDRDWRNVKLAVCYSFDDNGKKPGTHNIQQKFKSRLKNLAKIFRTLLIFQALTRQKYKQRYQMEQPDMLNF